MLILVGIFSMGFGIELVYRYICWNELKCIEWLLYVCFCVGCYGKFRDDKGIFYFCNGFYIVGDISYLKS